MHFNVFIFQHDQYLPTPWQGGYVFDSIGSSVFLLSASNVTPKLINGL